MFLMLCWNTMTESNKRNKEFILSYNSKAKPIIEGSQDRNPEVETKA